MTDPGLGVCIYCGKWTTDKARACRSFGALARDYGHDYNHEPLYVQGAIQERLRALEERVEDLEATSRFQVM